MENNEKKKYKPSITVFQTNQSLVDFQDMINDKYMKDKKKKDGTIEQVEVYSDDINMIVHNHKGSGHKERGTWVRLGVEEALFLAKHITEKTFYDNVYNEYNGKKYPGTYRSMSGIKVARVLTIRYADKKNKEGQVVGKQYELTIGWYQPKPSKYGITQPDFAKKIDEHMIPVDETSMIQMMLRMQVYIQAAMNQRLMKELFEEMGFGQLPVNIPSSAPPKVENNPNSVSQKPVQKKFEPKKEVVMDFPDVNTGGFQFEVDDDSLPF